MGDYTVEWIGEDPQEVGGKNSWAVAGKDAFGNRFTKTKLELPPDITPTKGQTFVDYELVDHPKLQDKKLLTSAADAQANGNTPSDATSGPVSASNTRSGDYQREYSPSTQKRVNRHTAFEGAVELAKIHLEAGVIKPEQVVGWIWRKTDELVPAVEGGADPKGRTEDEIANDIRQVEGEAQQPNPEDLF